ncbi:MAG: right-handed parallel beta-helix repeat-containing protein [Phycisphaeraceae bacterium]|nr:right-handed parallel beta-helix repeat-containing protein [Phycisphaeraceae bacterium]MCB9848751.1 right-handed parallel beta-helix repeat-containing protein [Phycisphaeraceae bacterium]
MRKQSLTVAVAIALISALNASPPAVAGDLTPPPGAVAPTMKPLDIVEPRIPIGADTTPGDASSVYRITESGSYYMTGNIAGEPGKHGIDVQLQPGDLGSVSIDLSGMTLLGVPGSLSGVSFPSGRADVANGTVSHWGGSGVQVGSGVIDNVSANFNGQDGVSASWGTLVHHCIAEGNTRDGIAVGDVSRVESCVSKVNGRWGVHADGAVTIADNVIYNNDGGGIEAGLAHITGNMLFSNSAGGILDRGLSTIASNTVHSGAVGIQAQGNDSRIEDNQIIGCITGVEVMGTDNLVIANSVRQSTTSYNIAPGNQAGAIVISPVGAGPWDNFQD